MFFFFSMILVPVLHRQPFAAEPTAITEQPQVAAATDLTGYVQYKALYDYEARNPVAR